MAAVGLLHAGTGEGFESPFAYLDAIFTTTLTTRCGRSSTGGFSLVELLVVIALIGVLISHLAGGSVVA